MRTGVCGAVPGVLVTGANGFVGANLTRRLLDEGHSVHAIVRPDSSRWRLDAIRDDVSVYEVDVRDPVALRRVVAEAHPDWTFHLAAHGGSSWQTSMRDILETNVLGTLNVMEACLAHGLEAFVHAGSSSEYGFIDRAATEETWIDPNSMYAVGKASATLLGRYLARSTESPIVTLRLYSVFGPWEHSNRLMPTLVIYGLEGKWPPLTRPTTARDFVYVDDVVDAFILVAASPARANGAVYNVGSGVQTTLQDVSMTAIRTLQIPSEPVWSTMPDRDWDTPVWVADHRRITAALGWRPKYTLDSGFRRLVDWFQQNPALQQHYRSRLFPSSLLNE